ncbi:MAG: hypothetical protein JXA57_01285 [Armatimonadetes bacterium]|nr:hypothetical protein [Armatimonadota bacterium]
MTYANADPARCRVRVLNDDDLASLFREKGLNIVWRRGHYWHEWRGIYHPLHFAARIRADEARWPSPLCWAFHTPLVQTDEHRADTWSPVHLVDDLSAYDEHALDSSKRKQLRRARSSMTFAHITDPSLLRDQGWAIYQEKMRRVGLTHVMMSRDTYLAGLDSLVTDERRLIFAALVGDTLLGYAETFAVGDIAYLNDIWLSSEALRVNAGVLIYFEGAQVYRLAGVQQFCAGVPEMGKKGISDFKTRMGIPVVRIPARFRAVPCAKTLLRRVKPRAYYRITGDLPYWLD